MIKFFLICSLVSISAFAANREHKAHNHGAAKLDIAFQGSDGEVNLDAAAEGIYGFEYVPKTEADKKKQHDTFALIETNIADMVKFDADLKCEFNKTKIEVDQQGKHSDIEASFKVICQKSPIGSTITFNLQKTFPKLKEVSVQVIVDDLQKSTKVKKDGTKLVLKK